MAKENNMSATKVALIFLYGCVYTSMWWAAAVWGYGECAILWIIPTVSTIPILVFIDGLMCAADNRHNR